MGLRGSVRWLPPELMDSQHVLFDIDRLPARDIYSFGCTVIEACSFIHCTRRILIFCRSSLENRHFRLSKTT